MSESNSTATADVPELPERVSQLLERQSEPSYRASEHLLEVVRRLCAQNDGRSIVHGQRLLVDGTTIWELGEALHAFDVSVARALELTAGTDPCPLSPPCLHR